MAQKRLDDMTTQELDAWFKRWNRRQAVIPVLLIVLICALFFGARQALKVWTVHEETVMRARHQQELDAARRAGRNGSQPTTGSSICSPSFGMNCADQPALSVTSAPAAAATKATDSVR